MVITSLTNPKVKYLSKLMTCKKARDEEKLFIVEGEHLVAEAVSADVCTELIISDEGCDHYLFENKTYVTFDIMKKICDTVTPQGIIAVCKQNKKTDFKELERVLILDDIQDPGNIGTIIRTCDAFSFDGIVLSENSVDIYNPKVVRATQGAIFRVNFIRTELKSYIDYLFSQGVHVYGTSLAGTPLSYIESYKKMAFIMGNEGNGVSTGLLNLTDDNLFIEMSGQSESLNVAIASAIIMYKFRK